MNLARKALRHTGKPAPAERPRQLFLPQLSFQRLRIVPAFFLEFQCATLYGLLLIQCAECRLHCNRRPHWSRWWNTAMGARATTPQTTCEQNLLRRFVHAPYELTTIKGKGFRGTRVLLYSAGAMSLSLSRTQTKPTPSPRLCSCLFLASHLCFSLCFASFQIFHAEATVAPLISSYIRPLVPVGFFHFLASSLFLATLRCVLVRSPLGG